MRQRISSSLTFLGCFLGLLGFILPWYTKAFSGSSSHGSDSATISGIFLWLGRPTVNLTYVPGVVPEFFALLWVWFLAVLLMALLRVVELTGHHWRDRWLFLSGYTVLLAIQGIFLWPALLHATVQFGLWVCLAGWILLLLSVLVSFFSHVHRNVLSEASTSSHRRIILRGLVGIVGLMSLGGTGSFLLWRNWRRHTALTIYRFRQDTTGQTSAGNALGVNEVLSVDWSPNGKRILVAQLHAPPQSWDALTGEERTTYQPAGATSTSWSSDGQHIALGNQSDTDVSSLVILKAATGAKEATLTVQRSQLEELGEIIWSPDGQYLAIGDRINPVIQLWNRTTREFGATYRVPPPKREGINRIQDLAWSPDGRSLAAVVPEGALLPDGTLANGRSLASPGVSGVYIWNVQSGVLLFHYQAEMPSNPDTSSLLSWSPDSTHLACAHKTTVHILDVTRRQSILTYTGHPLTPRCVAWSPNGKCLASGAADWTVQVWEAPTGVLRFLYQGHTGVVNDVRWSPNGKYIASGSDDGTAQVWQPEI